MIRNQPARGEGREAFLDEPKGSPPITYFQDSYLDAHRHHVEPRVKLYTPKDESFPVPAKFIDVTKVTHTTLDVLQASRIDDCWNIDGARDLSDS